MVVIAPVCLCLCVILLFFLAVCLETFADDATNGGAPPMKHASDEIVSSAECSSDDEDLEECETSHAGGLGCFAFACFHCAFTHWTWRIEESSRHLWPMIRPTAEECKTQIGIQNVFYWI